MLRTVEAPWTRELSYQHANTERRVVSETNDCRENVSTCHSSNSSTTIRRDMVRPKFFAVVVLILRKKLLGKRIGKSPGLAPLRIFAVYSPTSLYESGKF